VKDLDERERETLAAHAAAVFEKGSGWRPALLERLRRLAVKSAGKRVLVADDNPAARELVSETLRDLVSALMEAANGREALQKIREARPDLVLLDIQMPEMDGYQVLDEIRRDPSLRNLRVVALTAFAMEGDREKALDAGFDDYLTKPVTSATLRAQLDAVGSGVNK
jgi:CheY-like chemotaxis protein